LLSLVLRWCRQREKIDWQEPPKFDCQLVQTTFQNQILIPDWTYFYCFGATRAGSP